MEKQMLNEDTVERDEITEDSGAKQPSCIWAEICLPLRSLTE
jgi:hypothetical protein